MPGLVLGTAGHNNQREGEHQRLASFHLLNPIAFAASVKARKQVILAFLVEFPNLSGT